ncbi:MAG: glycosyltransferase family 4 protein [Sphingomonadales bacterium]|nr:glycosyltransferase family 4 protein [Sphingomonadales bacterium]
MNRIAYLASEYPAPSHTFIRREIAALRAAGLNIAVFTIRPAGGKPASELDRAARAETAAVLGRSPVAYLGALLVALAGRPARSFGTLRLALRHRAPGLKPMIWALFHFVEAAMLARLLRRAGATRLHVHFANSGATVALLAANLLGIRWSMTLHGISETDYPAGLLLADKVARADFVACASWFMRAQAMRVADAEHWERLHVVRCGIDPAALPPPPPPCEDGRVRFASVGRLSREKGQRGLLEAFAAVRDRLPGARLDLVGDGPLRADLEALAAALGIGEAVRFHGALPEAETLAVIAGADIFVLPSFMEGLPVVIIEAMALGKPVIASGVAGIPELVRDGRNGVLVPPSHGAALAEAMARLAADPTACRRLGAAGQEDALADFAIERAVRPLIPLLTEGAG